MSEENIVNKIEGAPLEQPEDITNPDSSTNIEQAPERIVEKKEVKSEPSATPQAVAPVVSRPKSEYQIRSEQIEQILSDGLSETYLQMPPQVQAEFRAKGEETTRKINVLLGQAKVKIKKVAELIRNWLKIIPGVNRFFLEQEAKIKADKIIKLKK